MSQKERKN